MQEFLIPVLRFAREVVEGERTTTPGRLNALVVAALLAYFFLFYA